MRLKIEEGRRGGNEGLGWVGIEKKVTVKVGVVLGFGDAMGLGISLWILPFDEGCRRWVVGEVFEQKISKTWISS